MTRTMDINDVGMTAFFIAYFRDAERNRKDSLFDDPYSQWFVPDEVKPWAANFAELCPEFETLIRCRLLLFRELLRTHIAGGVRQVVSVGFDTRPATFRTEGVTFFDVDQPAVVQYKRQALEAHGLEPWPSVPCNYLEVDLPQRIREAGFDADMPSLFIWEGNTMYLPRDTVFSFLNQLADSLPAFTIAFDFMANEVVNRSSGVDSVNAVFDYFFEQFAPFITGFDDASVFEQVTPLKIVETGGMEDVFLTRSPQYAASLAPLAKLYNYCILAR